MKRRHQRHATSQKLGRTEPHEDYSTSINGKKTMGSGRWDGKEDGKDAAKDISSQKLGRTESREDYSTFINGEKSEKGDKSVVSISMYAKNRTRQD